MGRKRSGTEETAKGLKFRYQVILTSGRRAAKTNHPCSRETDDLGA